LCCPPPNDATTLLVREFFDDNGVPSYAHADAVIADFRVWNARLTGRGKTLRSDDGAWAIGRVRELLPDLRDDGLAELAETYIGAAEPTLDCLWCRLTL
jgi:hypothetical protein